ncbi:carboxymuconolactone decarboxylase family protein [Streptomyces sp. MMS24-I2-30]|uniref:carboxymuconolactone decarboxylase family protein n=1 Tax=Streptomyces sp. MMS24-I2-30 TaxID=3351564 RepID=UPI003896CDB3
MTRTQVLDRSVAEALSALSGAAERGLGDPVLAELVMIRASQLNHCAFCLDMHLAPAPKNGVSENRLQLLNAREEAEDHYSERERAALAFTEAVTVLTASASRTASGRDFVPDAVYERAAKHFDETELAHLVGLITAINSWNRLMVSRRVAPGGYRP